MKLLGEPVLTLCDYCHSSVDVMEGTEDVCAHCLRAHVAFPHRRYLTATGLRQAHGNVRHHLGKGWYVPAYDQLELVLR